MTEKELKKLNRYQLLELIILQTEQINELENQLSRAKEQLEAQQIQASQAGSIADAALQLSGIFKAAQTAADTYLQNVKRHTENADRIEEEAKASAEQLLKTARAEADSLVKNAQTQADTLIQSAQAMMAETTRRCSEKEAAVDSYIANIREAFHLQFQNLDQITKK